MLYKVLISVNLVLFVTNIKAQALNIAELETEPLYSLEEALQKDPLNVYKLSLKKMKLTELPKEIFQFKNLQILNLKSNNLKIFPKKITTFKYLEELNIAANKIEVIPKELGELIHLKRFIAGSNNIVSIPTEIENLKQLTYLDLWRNNIKTLPYEIQELQNNLKEIDLRVSVMSKKEHQKIKKILPNTKIRFSQSCNCGF